MAWQRLVVISWIALGIVAKPTFADSWDRIQQRGTLIWGGDKEGGAPFVFPSADDPTQVKGCDVELMELIAAKLGLRAEFVQGQWDKLPDLLDRGDIDLVLSGYEWTANRAARYGTSIPYYLYELQLLARKEDPTISRLDDLRKRPGEPRRRVAVLGGSAAQDYLEQHFGDDIEIVIFDGVTDAMRAVELGVDGIDANLQDLPIVVFYESGFPALRRVGEPVGMGSYVILTRKEDQRLLAAVNDALVESLRDGSLRRIFERYGMWNATQQRRGLETNDDGGFQGHELPPNNPAISADAPPAPELYTAESGWDVIRKRTPLLLRAAWMTVKLSFVAMPLAVLLGLAISLGRLYGPRLLRPLFISYVEIVRGTPLVLQLYIIFFLLPEVGVRIDAFWAAILGLAINYSAYEAEIYRAGMQAIPQGQMEAALALGMSRGLAIRRIIIPQATRLVIPPVTNDFIALFKDTAVCSVITIVELTKEYYIQARSTGAIVELGIVTALLYLAMSYPLSVFTGVMERRLANERRA